MSSQTEEPASQFDDLVQTRLPLSKVKKIAKIDPDVHMINAEAIKLMAKGTEDFISLLAKAAFTQAVLDKRKTIQTKDINTVIKQSPVFQLLQGALEGWPEPEKVDRSKTPTEGEETGDTAKEREETVEEEETEDTAEETEDDTGLENETEEDETEEDENEDKENEFVENEDSEMAETVPNTGSDSLPDTVPLTEDSSMDHE